jgi:hypothetical protein
MSSNNQGASRPRAGGLRRDQPREKAGCSLGNSAATQQPSYSPAGWDVLGKVADMLKTISFLTSLAVLAALTLASVPAEAQPARTFVSSFGDDLNPCSRTAPCRTFQRAHDNTLSLGEITVLDPGGYGAVTITKAISIINDGVGEAGILVSGGANGITINAGAGDAVSLRGLSIKGIGFGGGNGIVFNSGKSLAVENCAIRNVTDTPLGNGIRFIPNFGSSSLCGPGGGCIPSSSLALWNTVVADNAGTGIEIAPAGIGAVYATFDKVEVRNSGANGFTFDATALTAGAKRVVRAAITDSVASRNAANGIVARGVSAVVITRSVAIGNATGLLADAGGDLSLDHSVLAGNEVSWKQNEGTVRSFVNNNIIYNFDGDPAPPSSPAK